MGLCCSRRNDNDRAARLIKAELIDTDKYKLKRDIGKTNEMRSSSAKILMAMVCIARGTSFLFSKTLMNTMSPMSVMGARFTLSFIILAIVFNDRLRHISKATLKGGIMLGVGYTITMIFEMYGLRLIDTGTSAFVENMAIVLVPIYAAILTRVLPKFKTICCAVIAVLGVGGLSYSEMQQGGSALGIILAICSALAYAACIMLTDKVSKEGDPIAEGMIQLGIMGVLTLIMAFFTGGLALPSTGNQWAMMGCLVLICSCFGFAFQPVAQKYMQAETAAMFTVVNPLSCSVLGILVAGEDHGIVKIIGCVLIIAAMVIYNMNLTRQPESALRR